MKKGLLFTIVTAIIFTAPLLSVATDQRDSAVIQNSGSTNTAGFAITIWSDATGNLSAQGGTSSTFSLHRDLSQRFFADLKAASAELAPVAHCMKSVSFGTRTTVQWHAWTSPDLQCPPLSPGLGALANDVQAIESLCGASNPVRHRIGLPPDVRKIPTATPEVQPT